MNGGYYNTVERKMRGLFIASAPANILALADDLKSIWDMAIPPKLRSLLLTLHLVGGLVAALVLIVLGATGCLLVYETQIDHWLNRGLTHVAVSGPRLSLDELSHLLEQSHPGTRVSSMQFSIADDETAFRVSLRPAAPGGGKFDLGVDQYTGRELGSLNSANTFMGKVHQLHTSLMLGPNGRLAVVIGGIFLVVLAITGLILWWPRRIWKVSASGKRLNFDLHNALGFYSSLFMLVFGLTGMVVHWDGPTSALVNKLTGVGEEPAAKPVSKNAAGIPLTAGGAEEIALKTMSGAKITMISGLGGTQNPVRISMRYPEDRTPGGRTTVLLDPRTGDILMQRSSRTATPGFRIAQFWNREIHTGDIYGWPTRILASLASLALPVLAITGPLIWLAKRRR